MTIPTVEDLIVMKAIARRDRDLNDLDRLIETYPSTDWKRVRYWLDQFTESMDEEDLWQIVEQKRKKLGLI